MSASEMRSIDKTMAVMKGKIAAAASDALNQYGLSRSDRAKILDVYRDVTAVISDHEITQAKEKAA